MRHLQTFAPRTILGRLSGYSGASVCRRHRATTTHRQEHNAVNKHAPLMTTIKITNPRGLVRGFCNGRDFRLQTIARLYGIFSTPLQQSSTPLNQSPTPLNVRTFIRPAKSLSEPRSKDHRVPRERLIHSQTFLHPGHRVDDGGMILTAESLPDIF